MSTPPEWRFGDDRGWGVNKDVDGFDLKVEWIDWHERSCYE